MFEHRLKIGTKAIFHLEAFVAKVMSLQKHHTMGVGFPFARLVYKSDLVVVFGGLVD